MFVIDMFSSLRTCNLYTSILWPIYERIVECHDGLIFYLSEYLSN